MFVAVWPPPTAVAAIAAVAASLQDREPLGARLRWATPEQWHVTLRFFGQVDAAAAIAAFRSVPSVEPGGGPVVAEMGPATGRFGRRVLHVPVAGLDGLAALTTAATAGVGEPPDERPFAGHVTLARSRPPRGTDLSALVGHPVTAQWEVSELTLVASRPAGAGARYEIVDRRFIGEL